MKALLAFLTKRDWLGHIVEAAVMASVVSGITYASLWLMFGTSFYLTPWLVGGAFAVGHFHGREKRDCEVRLHMKPPHLDGYKFWLWNKDELTDFFPVLGLYALLFLFIWS